MSKIPEELEEVRGFNEAHVQSFTVPTQVAAAADITVPLWQDVLPNIGTMSATGHKTRVLAASFIAGAPIAGNVTDKCTLTLQSLDATGAVVDTIGTVDVFGLAAMGVSKAFTIAGEFNVDSDAAPVLAVKLHQAGAGVAIPANSRVVLAHAQSVTY